MSDEYSLKVVRAYALDWQSRLHRNLPNLYVKVTLGRVSKRTRTLKANASPAWDEILTFSSSRESTTFNIQLRHDSVWSSNPCVGYINLELAELLVRCVNGEAALCLSSVSRASTTPTGTLILQLQAVDIMENARANIRNAAADVQQHEIAHALGSLASLSDAASRTSSQGDLYQAIGALLSQLEVFKNFLDVVSKVHPFLAIAWQVASVLYTSATTVFRTDKRVVGLVRTMEDAFSFVRDLQVLSDKVRSLEEPIIGLLKQTTECCLFVREYTRHGFVGRMLDLTSSTKLDEFESSFADLKQAIDSGLVLQTTFVSMRVSEGVDKLLLRQRLDPTLAKGFDRPVCLPGTRVEVQQSLIDWLVSDTKQNMFWLYGVTGSGKSTVSTTISEYFRGLSRLGAFLFFEREKSEPSTVIQTLAYKLALFDSSIGSYITSEVDKDKDVISSSYASQFDTLLLRPLSAAVPRVAGPVVIVLDGLDECGTPQSRRILMQLFRQNFPKLPNNFRFLITSRREADIDKVLSSLPESVFTMDLDYTSASSQYDVLSYLRTEMDDAVRKQVEIPSDWPWDANMDLLGKFAGGLFVWASTAVSFVSHSEDPFFNLKELVSDSKNFVVEPEVQGQICKGYGFAPAQQIALSSETMDEILGFAPEEPSILILCRLQSLLRFTPGEPVSLFHTSFSDYLMSTERSSDPWFIDISVQQHFIATRCFHVMKAMLRFNICNLETSFVCNDDVEGLEERIKSNIPAHLAYVCLHWSQHLCDVPYSPDLLNKLSSFAYHHLLFWFEVLSLLKALRRIASRAFRDANTWINTQTSDIGAFLSDASNLSNTFAIPISNCVPHIYLSMLPMTKGDSVVSSHYANEMLRMTNVKRRGMKVPPMWSKVLEGHSGGVLSAAFSHDGRRIVSGSQDHTIIVWDLDSGEAILRPIIGHAGIVFSVSFSGDGRRIVSGSFDNTVQVWDAHSGELILGPIEGHTRVVSCVTFTPDGSQIISGSHDTSIRVWDAKDGKPISDPLIAHSEEVYSIAVSPDGTHLVSGSRDKTIRVWDLTAEPIESVSFEGHSAPVMSVSFSSDSSHIVSGSGDKTIRVWEVASGNIVLGPLVGHTHSVYAVAFSRDGSRIVSGSWDKTIRVWDARSGELVCNPFKGHSEPIRSVSFSPDARSILSCSDDKTIRVWENRAFESHHVVGHTDTIWSVAISFDGSRIVTGSADRSIIVWDAFNGEIHVGPLDGHTGEIQSVAFSSSGSQVVSGSRDKTIRIWNTANGAPVSGPFEGHKSAVSCVAFAPDSPLIASGSWDKTIRIWDAEKGDLGIEPLVGHTDAVTSVSFSPCGTRLVSAGNDITIRIWNVETGSTIFESFKGHTAEINFVSFAPDGGRIVSSSHDKTVIVWDTMSGQIVAGPFIGHDRLIWSAIFSPDGRHVISASDDKTIRIWDVKSGQAACRPLWGHSDEVNALAVSPDGKRLYSGSEDKTVRVWDVEGILVSSEADGTEGDTVVVSSGGGGVSDWRLGENGWIRGGCNGTDLVLWIPPDLRPTLWHPQSLGVWGCSFSTELDFTDAALGEHWSKCFSPSNNLQESE